MYKFVKPENGKDKLFYIYENEELNECIGLIRMKDGIATMFPMIYDEVGWGIPIESWFYDDISKTDLTPDEEAKMLAEAQTAMREYKEEIANYKEAVENDTEVDEDEDSVCY